MKNLVVTIGVIVIGVLIYFGVRSYYPHNSATTTGPTQSTEAVEPNSISIKDFAFDPSSISTKVGQMVTFTNNDSVAHTVVADDNSFESGDIVPGATFTKTFDSAATIGYHCGIHPSMKGEIIIK